MEELYTTEIDCTTGETVTRLMTTEEVASYQALQAEAEAERIAREEAKATQDALKESAKAKLIAGEPLTPEEAALLIA